MLLKDAVRIEGGLGVDHFLISDRFLLALSATLLATLSFLRWLLSACTVGSSFDVGNLPTLFQLVAHIANSVVTDLGDFTNLSIAFARVSFNQLGNQLPLLLRSKMTTLDVSGDDVGLRIKMTEKLPEVDPSEWEAD